LFACVAIVAIYGDDVVKQNMRSDETLFYFSTLAMHMNGNLVLRKARGLLHKFRLLPRIPCTLVGLCQLCSPGQWDSGHVPTVECTGEHEEEEQCSYGGVISDKDPEQGQGNSKVTDFKKLLSFPSFGKWTEK
jgi:hypothetical protein